MVMQQSPFMKKLKCTCAMEVVVFYDGYCVFGDLSNFIFRLKMKYSILPWLDSSL